MSARPGRPPALARTPQSLEAYALRKARRRAAGRAMRAVAALCAAAALGIGAEQLHAEGWAVFVDRPPGVGATPVQASPEPAPPPTPAASRGCGVALLLGTRPVPGPCP